MESRNEMCRSNGEEGRTLDMRTELRSKTRSSLALQHCFSPFRGAAVAQAADTGGNSAAPADDPERQG